MKPFPLLRGQFTGKCVLKLEARSFLFKKLVQRSYHPGWAL
jgi:hypothetical protein